MKFRRLVASLCLWAVFTPTAQAALFQDDEARRAILDLRQRLENQRQTQLQSSEQTLQKALEQSQKQFDILRKQAESDINQSKQDTRQAVLQLQAQIDALKQDIANLNGEREQLLREITLLQRALKETNAGIE